MSDFIYKLAKIYNIILNILFGVLIVFTGFVIVYYALPNQVSVIIAKALSVLDNEALAQKFMNYLNGFTLGAGFPTLVMQKTCLARFFIQRESKYGALSTKALLGENLNLSEIQIEFQKAEAYRFVGSPTMPAKARLHYKAFIEKLEEREKAIKVLQGQVETRTKTKKVKKIKDTSSSSTDALI